VPVRQMLSFQQMVRETQSALNSHLTGLLETMETEPAGVGTRRAALQPCVIFELAGRVLSRLGMRLGTAPGETELQEDEGADRDRRRLRGFEKAR
jgi:hypothetical protein